MSQRLVERLNEWLARSRPGRRVAVGAGVRVWASQKLTSSWMSPVANVSPNGREVEREDIVVAKPEIPDPGVLEAHESDLSAEPSRPKKRPSLVKSRPLNLHQVERARRLREAAAALRAQAEHQVKRAKKNLDGKQLG